MCKENLLTKINSPILYTETAVLATIGSDFLYKPLLFCIYCTIIYIFLGKKPKNRPISRGTKKETAHKDRL